MAHLTYFGLEHFRSFNELTAFEFKPITLLTGTNSSGKSSLTKALLLFKDMPPIEAQNNTIGRLVDNSFSYFDSLKFNTSLNIGNFESCLNKKTDSNVISFEFPFYFKETLKECILKVTYITDDSMHREGRLAELIVTERISGQEILYYSLIAFRIDVFQLWHWVEEYETQFKAYFQFETKMIDILKKLYGGWEEDDYLDALRGGLRNILQGQSQYEFDYTRYFEDEDRPYQITLDRKEILTLLDQEEEIEFRKYASYLNKLHSIQNKQNFSLQNIVEISSFIDIDSPLLAYNFSTADHALTEFYNSNVAVTENIEIITNTKNEGLQNEKHQRIVNLIREKELQAVSDYINKVQTGKGLTFKDCMAQIEALMDPNWGNSDKGSYIESLLLLNDIVWDAKNDETSLKKFVLTGHDEIEYQHERGNSANYKGFLSDVILSSFRDSITNLSLFFNQLTYIPSIRNNVGRFYAASGNGSYFLDVLNEATRVSFPELMGLKAFINGYLTQFEIAEEIDFSITGDSSLVNVYLRKDGEQWNLADFGYGINQFLPLLLKIGLVILENIKHPPLSPAIIIEEPETNLHPALQSMLADLLIDCYKRYNIQFIIETHSEYLIRKLQVLSAKNTICHKDVNIYYFYPPNRIPEGKKQVFEIKIEDDGALSKNFGQGFFDESSNLNIALYNYSRTQKN